MKTKTLKHIVTLGLIILAIVAFSPDTAFAQRMSHGGGARGHAAVSRPSGGQNRSINGGSSRPSPAKSNVSRPANRAGSKVGNNRGNNIGDRNLGNKVNSGNKTNLGNKVNIDNSKKNVNINVDNSKHVNVNNSHNRYSNVRVNTRPYNRPPYRYGGRSYYSYHPYHYHSYRPFYWGPVYHPWGFFIASLATTAIIISVENQKYHYDQGVYYVQSGSGYTVVQAPVGATITTLPPNSQTVVVNETTNNYYYGGTYYEKSGSEYTVVAPTAGTLVENLPDGGEEIKIGDVTYVKVGDTYYQPVQQNGKNMYEVVEVKDGD